MAIDRAARAQRRQELRAAHEAEVATDAVAKARQRAASGAMELEGLFSGAGVRHRLDQLEWVAVAKEDDREAGAGPLDLDSGVVRIERADLL